MEIVNITYNGEGVDYQDYSKKDDGLVLTSVIYNKFGFPNDIIEYHIYDENGAPLDLEYNTIKYYPSRVNAVNDTYSEIELDPKGDVYSKGYTRGTVNIHYNFLRNLFRSKYDTTYWIKEISVSRTEIKLSSQAISDAFIRLGFDEYQVYSSTKNYYSDFYLNFGDNKLVICTNVGYTEDDNGSYLLIKLYEPLPLQFDVKTQLWIVDKVGESASFIIDTQVESLPVVQSNRLRGPNFKMSIDRRVGQTTPYYSYSNLYSSSFFDGSQKLLSYYDDDAVSINVDFSDFNNFIKFSSAKSRLDNFKYKLELIEDYTSQVAYQQSLSSTTVSSAAIEVLQGNINSIIEKFDIYEYGLYFDSASWAWPKSTITQPYTLYPVNSTQAQNWFATSSYSASLYDELNQDQLQYMIPQYIRDDCDYGGNEPYVRFIKMIGQHFDNIWIYNKDVTNRFDATNNPKTGISGDMVADALKGLGFTLYTNTNISDNLYYSLFGINQDGSLLPPVGNEIINTYVTSSIATIGANDLQKEIYKRLYHNLPYLVKTKGTRVGIQALINCFGIPEDILTVNEFGGYNRNSQAGIFELNNDKVRIIEAPLHISSSLLTPNTTIQYFSTENRLNITEVEVGFSPSDTINKNIAADLGVFDIDNLIGNPQYQYADNYILLDWYRNNYFSTYDQPHSLYEYLRTIKYFDNSLFKIIRNWIPARADASVGLIIKPHILERSKYARHEPSASIGIISQDIEMSEIEGIYGNIISGSTLHSFEIQSPLGAVQFTSSQGVEKFTGEFGGTVIDVVNGDPMPQWDYSNTTSSVGYFNYGAIHNNVSMSVRSKKFFDADYVSNQTYPTNYGLITQSINNSLVNYIQTYTDLYSPYAYLQDTNYSTKAWNGIRYDGSYTKSKLYSTYSVGDVSYGKTAAIDKLKYQFAYLVDIYSASAFFPGRSNAQIKYLIDNNQNVLDLTKANENIFDVQNVFKSGETTNVSLFEYDEKNAYSQQLLNKKDILIYEGGFRYLPILHNISGSVAGWPVTQSFELSNPIEAITQVPGGASQADIDYYSPVGPNSAVFNPANYIVEYIPTEDATNPQESFYVVDVMVTANFAAMGITTLPFGVNLNIMVGLGIDGSCDIPRQYTVSIPVNSNQGIVSSVVEKWALPTGLGGGTGPQYWPNDFSIDKNCSLGIRRVSAQETTSGTGNFIEFKYYTDIVSSSNACLYFLTQSNQVIFDKVVSYYYSGGYAPTFNYFSDPFITSSNLEKVVTPFSLTTGDRISFYSEGSLGWSEKFEYVVKNVSYTGSVTESRLLATLDSSMNINLLATSSVLDSVTNSNLTACRYVVWKHLPDETNVILKYNPKDSTLIENGLLFPQYIDEVVRKNSGNTLKGLKAQNLI